MRLSTGQRLTALIAGAILLVVLAGFAAQYVLVKRDLQSRQRALVEAELQGFAALYDQRRVIAVRQAIEYRLLRAAPGSVLLALRDRNGGLLAGNVETLPDDFTIPPEGSVTQLVSFSHGGHAYLGGVQSLPGGFTLLVARGTGDLDTTLAGQRRIIALVVAAAIAISLLVGHLSSRWMLRRIARFNALATQVAAGDLAARLPEPAREDEFALLQRHIHRMLDRIEALNRATHQLSDTIAHELRTPLARIQARLTRTAPDLPEAEALVAEIRDTIRIFDSLLQIARAEAGGDQGLDLVPLDLSRLAGDVAELYEAVAEDRGLTFRAEIAPDAQILGDRNLVAQLMSNLLDNAVKFSPPGAEVTMRLTRAGDRHALTVSDTGPGLPEGFESNIFDRFSRADRDATTPGHGLGMALVRAIAIRHGAKLHLPRVEKGFAIQIAWPRTETSQQLDPG